jgi:outer membrane protein assembly factor BamA
MKKAICLLILFFSGIFGFSQEVLPDSSHKINSIYVEGNRKTKASIVIREMAIHEGENATILQIERGIARSRQNLLNTSLFNEVMISYEINSLTNEWDIIVRVKERWYVWPNVILEIQDRNFNSWWETKDFFRTNYGLFMTFENVRGRNETAVLKFRRGYTEQYGFSYKIPYLNKKQTLGLSVAANYFRNNEVAYITLGNQLKFYRSYHQYVRTEKEGKIALHYRKDIMDRHTFEISAHSIRVNDTISRLNEAYFGKNQNTLSYFSMQYIFRRDNRDVKAYPLKGYCVDFVASKDGLNILSHEKIDITTFSIDARNYFKLMHRTYFSTGVKVRYMLNQKPVYYFNRAFGFNDFVRGYEYFVIDGQNFALLKTNLSYQIIQPGKLKIPIKRFEKFSTIPYTFYLRAFADAGYVQDKYFHKQNPLSNQILTGAGVGIDFVTYYDYVLRVELSMNKLMQQGIYLHFSAPL